MIEVENVSKEYGDLVALRDLSFAIPEGGVVGLLGANGAGKTTTMRILTTYLAPTSGKASLLGYDVCREADAVRREIGYLPEQPPLYNELTVREYLRFVARFKGLASAAAREAVDEAIAKCALGSHEKRLCGELSKGYRQRVGIAQAIVHNPRVIVLDEPTSGLDPVQIVEIRKLIKKLGERSTILLSTHVLGEVQETCSRVVIIADGRCGFNGKLSQLPQGMSLEQLFMQTALRSGRDSIADATVVEESLS